MKFPSLIRTNKFSQFHYEPRYYDPVREEIQGKLKAARLNNETDSAETYTSHISAAFRKRERKSSQASVVQLLIAAAMLTTFVGWVFYGNQVFYIYLFLSPLYFYFRWRGSNKTKD